jgi:hypothetical protein
MTIIVVELSQKKFGNGALYVSWVCSNMESERKEMYKYSGRKRKIRWERGKKSEKSPLLVVPAEVRYGTNRSIPKESVPHWLLGERSTSWKKRTPGSVRLLSPTYFSEILMFFWLYGSVSNSQCVRQPPGDTANMCDFVKDKVWTLIDPYKKPYVTVYNPY